MHSLKKDILKICKKMNIPLVGFSSVKRWENPPQNLPNKFEKWIPSEFWPQNIYPETKTVIVIGLPVQLPIVETTPSIYYHELYNTVNSILDSKAYELSEILNQQEFPSIFVPRDAYGDIDILLKKPLAFFSHRHAAYLAGLGSFGQNNVILTPEYGPRVRFTSIFTSAVIESDTIPGEDLCTRCLRCIDECPVHAIPSLPSANKSIFPEIIDKISCAKRSKSLRETYENPCGICIKVCPIGKDRKLFSRNDMDIYTSNKRYKKYNDAWEHVMAYGAKD